MPTETVFVPASTDVPHKDRWYWWLMSGNEWAAPEINNGEPYLPGWKNQTLRNVMWWLRNPAGNLMGWVLGVQGRDRWVTGRAPALKVSPLDEEPPRRGWKWAVTRLKPDGWLMLPFVSYYGVIEFYLGWRPHDGALGLKIVNSKPGEN